MKNTVFYLKTCDTSRRIVRELNLDKGFAMREIKSEPITPVELDEMKELAGSYEALFSRRSRQYSAMGLKDKALDEDDYRQLILDEYTFLKRPVIMIDGDIFIGNAAKNLQRLSETLHKKRG